MTNEVTKMMSRYPKVVDRLRKERSLRMDQARDAGEECGREWGKHVAAEDELRDVAELELPGVGGPRLDLLMRRSLSLNCYIRDCAEDPEWRQNTMAPYDANFTVGLIQAVREIWEDVRKHL